MLIIGVNLENSTCTDKIPLLIFCFLFQGIHRQPSLVYKRDVWEISIDHKTRILTKIIMLQHTDLVCLCLWLHWVGFWAILARFAGAYLLSESGYNRSKSNSIKSDTQTNKDSMLKVYYFVKILVSWLIEISHTSLLYTKLGLPVRYQI